MMCPLFKKRKEIRISSKYYLFIKNKWAEKMSTLTSGLSKQKLVFLLFLFVIITVSICIYNVYSAFSTKEDRPIDNGIRSNSNHLIVIKPALDITTETVSSNTEFENVSRFVFYLDSLKESESGKKILDSIKYYRPGLLDSLIFIENYYKINLKK